MMFTAMFFPKRELNIEDFPELGGPTIANSMNLLLGGDSGNFNFPSEA